MGNIGLNIEILETLKYAYSPYFSPNPLYIRYSTEFTENNHYIRWLWHISMHQSRSNIQMKGMFDYKAYGPNCAEKLFKRQLVL